MQSNDSQTTLGEERELLGKRRVGEGEVYSSCNITNAHDNVVYHNQNTGKGDKLSKDNHNLVKSMTWGPSTSVGNSNASTPSKKTKTVNFASLISRSQSVELDDSNLSDSMMEERRHKTTIIHDRCVKVRGVSVSDKRS